MAHAAPSYAAGVSEGQWASYAPLNVTYRDTTGFISEPQYVKDLNDTVSLTSIVETLYTATNVTVQVVSLFKNNTMRTEFENGQRSKHHNLVTNNVWRFQDIGGVHLGPNKRHRS